MIHTDSRHQEPAWLMAGLHSSEVGTARPTMSSRQQEPACPTMRLGQPDEKVAQARTNKAEKDAQARTNKAELSALLEQVALLETKQELLEAQVGTHVEIKAQSEAEMVDLASTVDGRGGWSQEWMAAALAKAQAGAHVETKAEANAEAKAKVKAQAAAMAKVQAEAQAAAEAAAVADALAAAKAQAARRHVNKPPRAEASAGWREQAWPVSSKAAAEAAKLMAVADAGAEAAAEAAGADAKANAAAAEAAQAESKAAVAAPAVAKAQADAMAAAKAARLMAVAEASAAAEAKAATEAQAKRGQTEKKKLQPCQAHLALPPARHCYAFAAAPRQR